MTALHAGRRVCVCLIFFAACAVALTRWHAGHQQAGLARLHGGRRLALNANRGDRHRHSRLRYYVHGPDDPAASAGPARAAAVLHVSAGAPVVGRGPANVSALHSKGRLVMLNASVCAADETVLNAELSRQGLGPDSPIAREGALSAYVADACTVAPPTTAAFVVGDIATCFTQTVFAKARPCGCTSTILLDLTRARHFGFDTTFLDAHDMPWTDKLPVAFWRGAATGTIKDRAQSARYHLLTRWAGSADPRVDVGMTLLPMSTGNVTKDAMLTATSKSGVVPEAMLRYRYLISAEGYDVATNLKWAMWSRSTVMMPSPTICSWFMEDRLVPWVHYVPVAHDFSNLTDALVWCEAAENAGVCERIGAAGRAYMEAHGFMDAELNRALGRAVAAAGARENWEW